MRRSCLILAFSVFAAGPLWAQTPEPAPAPVPDVKPPEVVRLDDSVEPQVTIKKRENDTVQKYRINGRLYKIVVTPKNGAPYTLIDQKGDGKFVPVDGPGAPALSVPVKVPLPFPRVAAGFSRPSFPKRPYRE